MPCCQLACGILCPLSASDYRQCLSPLVFKIVLPLTRRHRPRPHTFLMDVTGINLQNCFILRGRVEGESATVMRVSLAGPLLDAVQMSALYPDSKTFVDKKLKQSPGKIIKRFEELVKSNDGKSLTKEQIKEVSSLSSRWRSRSILSFS